jgi:hypothetical protein
MLRKSFFQERTKIGISILRGGPKHNVLCFVGILEKPGGTILTDVLRVKLLHQRSTQKSANFPEGYELFKGCYGEAKFCLKNMEIAVPRLKLLPVGWPTPAPVPRIVKETELKPACVLLENGRSTEVLKILEAEAEVFEIKHRIRRHASQSRARLDLVLELMSDTDAAIPICPDLADRFEALLELRTPAFLRSLLEQLDMPDSPPPEKSEPGLSQAP